MGNILIDGDLICILSGLMYLTEYTAEYPAAQDGVGDVEG